MVLGIVAPVLVVVGIELADDDPYVAEALVLVSPGVAAGRDIDGSAARDAAVVLQSEPLVAYVRDELKLDTDPPLAHGSVLEGSNVVVVRVESFAEQEGPEGLVVPTVADIANAYALALVDVRGEQLRAGFGGAAAEIDRRIALAEERLAALNEELAVAGDRDDPQVAAMERERDAVERRRASLFERLDDAAIDGASTTGDLQIVRRAVVPTAREASDLWRRTWIAALLGGAVGLGIVGLVIAGDGTRGRSARRDRALAATGVSRPMTSD